MSKSFLISFLSLVFVSQASAGVSNYLAWSKTEIDVCFGNPQTKVHVEGIKNGFSKWKEDEKAFIQKTLEDEYLPERTGYSFTGFGNCEDQKNHNVVLLKKSLFSLTTITLRGASTSGESIIIPSPTYPKAKGVVILTAQGVDRRSTIVHEFAHILGLQHEHDHPDSYAQATQRCVHYSKKPIKRESYLIYTPFDEESVMNYCHIDGSDSDIGLSQGDLEHIKILYERSKLYK